MSLSFKNIKQYYTRNFVRDGQGAKSEKKRKKNRKRTTQVKIISIPLIPCMTHQNKVT